MSKPVGRPYGSMNETTRSQENRRRPGRLRPILAPPESTKTRGGGPTPGRRFGVGAKSQAANIQQGNAHRAPPEVTGTVHHPRRGIFYASELLYHRNAQAYNKEFKLVENVCIIRFPPAIAALLQERLAAAPGNQDVSALKSETSPSSNSPELGLEITPSNKEDYRLFDISVEKELGNPNSAIKLIGILVELPCLMEVYKTLDALALFKANDVAQMIYVVYRSNPDIQELLNLKTLRDVQLWEWHAGLTPATHRIRQRRFKSFDVFEKVDIAMAERQICKILSSKHVPSPPILEASTEQALEEHLLQLENDEELDPNGEVSAVIGPENPILYAAVHGLSLRAAAEPFRALAHHENAHLLRYHTHRQRSELSLEQLSKFAHNVHIDIDDDIPDNLSDIYFEGAEPVVDATHEAAQLGKILAIGFTALDINAEEEIKRLMDSSMAKSMESSQESMSSEEKSRISQPRQTKK